MDVELVWLGRMSFSAALERQIERREEIVGGRATSTLFLVEHDPVVTLGAGFHESNLRLTREAYAARGIEIASVGRGGDVTYHGPGQLVAYPVFDLRHFGRDLHRWLRDLECALMEAVGEFGLSPRRFPPHTGVWVGDAKIAAIGVHVSRWVSVHGVALNCDADLSAFETIVPCGIHGYGVTSLSRELSMSISVEDAKGAVLRGFEHVFAVRLHG